MNDYHVDKKWGLEDFAKMIKDEEEFFLDDTDGVQNLWTLELPPHIACNLTRYVQRSLQYLRHIPRRSQTCQPSCDPTCSLALDCSESAQPAGRMG